MTPQEQQLIDGLVQRVNSTNLADKDADAEQRLQQGLASNPNAVYILAQTVIVQQYALDQAKQQLTAAHTELDTLRQQHAAAPPQKHTGFLESIFGSHDDQPAPPPSNPQPPPQSNYAPVQGYAPVQTAAPAQGYAPPPPQYAPQPGYGAPTMGGTSGGGFLRGAAQTAAGVAAGALAFQGVESLLHGFGGGGGMMGGGGGAPREEVINNYYDDDRGDRGDRGDRNDSRGFNDNNPNDANPGDNVFTDGNQSGADQNNFASDDISDPLDTGGSDDANFGSDDSNSFGDDGGSFNDDNSGF